MKTRYELAAWLEEIKQSETKQYNNLLSYFNGQHHPAWTAQPYDKMGEYGRPHDDPVRALVITTHTGTQVRVIWDDKYVIVKRADHTAECHVHPALDGKLTADILYCANDDEPCDCDEFLCGKHESQKCGCTTRTCEHDSKEK